MNSNELNDEFKLTYYPFVVVVKDAINVLVVNNWKESYNLRIAFKISRKLQFVCMNHEVKIQE